MAKYNPLNNMWVECIRLKLRFPTSKGEVTAEDLFNLSLDDLDKIYSDIDASLQGKGRSLKESNKTEEELLINLRLAIVKSIYEMKEKEIEEFQKSLVKKEKKQRLLKLINEKEDEVLSNKSIDELKELLNELD